MVATKSKSARFPSRQQIVDFIRASKTRVGKREIARAFRLDAEQKIELRRLLKELESAGEIDRGRGRRFHEPGVLPSVGVIEITGVDTDGETVARPFGWTDGPPPLIYVAPEKRSRAAYAAGERVLARLTRTDPGAYEARVMRRLAAAPDRTLGVVTAVGESMRIVCARVRPSQSRQHPFAGRVGGAAALLGCDVDQRRRAVGPAEWARHRFAVGIDADNLDHGDARQHAGLAIAAATTAIDLARGFQFLQQLAQLYLLLGIEPERPRDLALADAGFAPTNEFDDLLPARKRRGL